MADTGKEPEWVCHGCIKERLGKLEAIEKAKPRIICLCGSTRFVGEMAVKAWELEKRGIIVLSPHLLPQWYAGVKEHHQAEAEGVAHVLDELHLRKIDLADEVLVMNVNGYIGQRTSVEIHYAETHSKPVRFLITAKNG